MITYLLESSICMIVLYAIYYLLLRNEKQFIINRLILLFSLGISMILPLLKFGSNQVEGYVSEKTFVLIENVQNISAQPLAKSVSIENYILAIYFAGAFVFLLLFIRSLVRLVAIILKSEKQKSDGLVIVYQNEIRTPSSFFNYIFLTRDNEYNAKELDYILIHEKHHVKALHSFDLLLVHLIQILFWFNPIVHLYKKSLKSQHEYASDSAVVSQKNLYDYKMMILNTMARQMGHSLVHTFNTSYIKERIGMLSRPKTDLARNLKVLFILPALAILALTFSCESEKSISSKENGKEIQIRIDNNNGIYVSDEKVTLDRIGSKTLEQMKDSDDDLSEYLVIIMADKDVQMDLVAKVQLELRKVNARRVEFAEPSKDSEPGPVYNIVEVQPRYPDGANALYAFLAEEIKYPKEALNNGIEGRVHLTFIVETDGSLTNFSIQRGIGSGCDEEALRVIQKVGNFIPGTQKGVKVRTLMTLPVEFKIEE